MICRIDMAAGWHVTSSMKTEEDGGRNGVSSVVACWAALSSIPAPGRNKLGILSIYLGSIAQQQLTQLLDARLGFNT